MTKPTLLFDARGLINIRTNGSNRGGIFFAALNVLKQFYASNRFDITLYCPAKEVAALRTALESELGFSVKTVFDGVSAKKLEKLSAIELKKLKFKAEKKNLRKFLCSAYGKLFSPRKVSQTFDLYFSPQESPLPQIKAGKRFLLLHDTIPLLFESKLMRNKGWYYRVIVNMNARDGYFANSQNTKKDFLRFCPQVPPEHITVTPLAAAESFRPITDKVQLEAVREKYHLPAGKKYVFSLCSLGERKNLIRAVKTFLQFADKNKADDIVFVLGGACLVDFMKKLESEFKDLGKNADKIIRAGYVDDADLPALYSGAQWFVYTSQYEGFGLPPLEAMQCGCPVITSNNSSLPEVVGDAGISIDWDSDEQHVKAYEDYYFNDNLRRTNAEKGLMRAKLFSWKNTTDIMIKEMLG